MLLIVWQVLVPAAQTFTLTIGMFAAALTVLAATTTATWLLASVAGVLDTGAPAARVVVELPVLLVLPVLVLLVLLVVLVGVLLDPPPPPQPATSPTAAAKPNAPSARTNLL